MGTKQSKSSKNTTSKELSTHTALTLSDVTNNLRNHQRFISAWSNYYDLYCQIKEKVEKIEPKISCLFFSKNLLSKKKSPQYEEWIKKVNEKYSMVLAELDESWTAMKCYFNAEWENVGECRFTYVPYFTVAEWDMIDAMGSVSERYVKVTDYETCESLLGSRTYELRDTRKFRGTPYDPNGYYIRLLTEDLFRRTKKYDREQELEKLERSILPEPIRSATKITETEEKQARTIQATQIHTPKNVEWKDIKFHFADVQNINISINNKVDHMSSLDLGFKHQNQNKNKLAWGYLLGFALEKDNTLNKKTIANLNNCGLDLKSKTLKDRVKEINTALKKVFTALTKNPIFYNKEATPYGYKPRFQISHNPNIVDYLKSLRPETDEGNN